jgi:hypothetical protein
MSDQQIDEFLEHFGVKGMHWGIRNQQKLDRVSRVARGTELRKYHNKEVAKRVAVVGAAVGATAVVSAILARKGMMSVNEANRMADIRAAKHLMQLRRTVKVKSLTTPAHAKDLQSLRSFVSKL